MSQNTAVKERKAKPVARKDMTKAQWTLKEMKKHKAGYFMIAPFFLLFFALCIGDCGYGLMLTLIGYLIYNRTATGHLGLGTAVAPQSL